MKDFIESLWYGSIMLLTIYLFVLKKVAWLFMSITTILLGLIHAFSFASICCQEVYGDELDGQDRSLSGVGSGTSDGDGRIDSFAGNGVPAREERCRKN